MNFKKNKLYIENIEAKNIARKFGTPSYCYSFNKLKNNISCMFRKIPSFLLIVGIFCGCSQNLPLSAKTMKSHHLADGTFKNNYIDSINKPFS